MIIKYLLGLLLVGMVFANSYTFSYNVTYNSITNTMIINPILLTNTSSLPTNIILKNITLTGITSNGLFSFSNHLLVNNTYPKINKVFNLSDGEKNITNSTFNFTLIPPKNISFQINISSSFINQVYTYHPRKNISIFITQNEIPNENLKFNLTYGQTIKDALNDSFTAPPKQFVNKTFTVLPNDTYINSTLNFTIKGEYPDYNGLKINLTYNDTYLLTPFNIIITTPQNTNVIINTTSLKNAYSPECLSNCNEIPSVILYNLCKDNSIKLNTSNYLLCIANAYLLANATTEYWKANYTRVESEYLSTTNTLQSTQIQLQEYQSGSAANVQSGQVEVDTTAIVGFIVVVGLIAKIVYDERRRKSKVG